MIKLPRLYVGDAYKKDVHPISVSITQNITPLSTASISLPRGEELPARSYVELFTPYGSAGMFRVRSPHDAYGDSYSTAELEHMVSEIGDYLVKDEISEMISANTAVSKAFGYYKGSRWQLGSYSAIGTGKIALDAKYESVLNVLLSILEQVPSCMMTFDFSAKPWKLNIVQKGTSVSCEGRLSRNVQSATVTYDDSELVTRVWYQTFSKNEKGSVVGTWVSRDASTRSKYGTIEATVSTSSDMSDAEINSVVNQYISDHKDPRTSVSIQANELSQITGERMDKFLIGDLCRLTLPEYNLITELHITSITWGDVYNNPQSMMIHLGDEEDTVITFLHNLDSTGSGTTGGAGGGRAASRAGQQATAFQQSFAKTDMYGSILEQAGMYLDSHGLLVYAQDMEKNIGSMFNVTAERIDAEVTAREAQGTELSGMIQVQAGRVGLVVERRNGKDVIKSASIVAAINNDGSSSAIINADHVRIDGNTKINDVFSVSSGSVVVKVPMRAERDVMTSSLTLRAGSDSITLTDTNMATAIKNARVSGNTLILTPFRGDDINFSRAVGTWVWGGGSGKVNVTALPQNQTKSVNVSIDGVASITSNGTYTYTVDYENADGDDVSTGATKIVNVQVGSSYVSHNMTCTDITNVSGRTYKYTFTIEGSYNFAKNSSYAFYRTSW